MDSVDGGRYSLDILLTSLVVQIFDPPFLIGRRARKMIVSKKKNPPRCIRMQEKVKNRDLTELVI